jgi:cell division initiation protein
MITPNDIDKKDFTRDKKGYNSREVDEFLDLIIVDYEKCLADNRSMAHKIKYLEKQLEEAQKTDNAMLDTLETAKRLMADISASAERRAELMIRDAELEAETMVLDAKATVRKLNEEHKLLKGKVERLKANYRRLLEEELSDIDTDPYGMEADLDRSDLKEIDKAFEDEPDTLSQETLVAPSHKEKVAAASAPAASKEAPKAAPAAEPAPVKDPMHATVADLSDSLKKIAEDTTVTEGTIILK